MGGCQKSASVSKPKIVILGMLTKIPVGGVVWLVGQYAVGFQRLGFDVYYVEAHGRTPSMFMQSEHDDGVASACAFIDSQLARFGLSRKWAYHAVHHGDGCYGMSLQELRRLYHDAALIINLHGSTVPLEEHSAGGRLVYMGTDPADVEIEVSQGVQETIEYLEPHFAFFTWGLNHGNPDCLLPWSGRFPFVPSAPPVVMDFWDDGGPPGRSFTTIGNWRQEYRDVVFNGERYTWSKHHEFMKVIDLPQRVSQPLELALSSYTEDDRRMLEAHGWAVRGGLELSLDPDTYREYIQRSRGEFSAAKDQNVRLRTGWFSERSATYLAAGRPLVVQDTGFGNALPTGEGLLAFSDICTAAASIDTVNSDYKRHSLAATEVAREMFNYDVVLGAVLEHVGLSSTATPPRRRVSSVLRPTPLPDDLDLVPRSRRPLELARETVERVLARPVPCFASPRGDPTATIIVPVLDNLVCTRMALESALASTEIAHELLIIDNGSQHSTREYLSVLSSRNPQVRIVRNQHNLGFAKAVNQGLEAARGDVLVILNNDTLVTPGWLEGLAGHLADAEIGLVGPVTNRCGNAAEVETSYRTYGELLQEAAERRRRSATVVDLPVAVMFCVALRRSVLDTVGVLDERFGTGMFEDDDYARRVREAKLRVACAEDVLVHHVGEATIGDLAATGVYGELFRSNRLRYEEKWGVRWEPHQKRADAGYEALISRMRDVVERSVARGSIVLVLSKGDPAMVDLPGAQGWHFPQMADGEYAGHHPGDARDAIDQLEQLRQQGAEYLVVPATGAWWLEYYSGFAKHLEDRYTRLPSPAATAVIYHLRRSCRVDPAPTRFR